MKITINGSPKELAELAKVLGSIENVEKKHELPPLLTELAEDEKINKLAEAIRNADKEDAPQVKTAEHKKNQEVFEKQMELLSKSSEFCVADVQLTQHLSALTHAMIELNLFCNRD